MRKSTDKPEKEKPPIRAQEVRQKKAKKGSTTEFKDKRPETQAIKQLQSLANDYSAEPIQTKKNDTGLPDQLKSGIESASGHSMDDVKVHRNSSKPSQLNAHAYAQGTDIHLASGQEKHLPHEAWHVVQQKQGRVKPTTKMKGGININDDTSLEKEADVMGNKVVQGKKINAEPLNSVSLGTTVQLVKDESKRQETDVRMDHLVLETKVILKFLKQQGEDWAKIYGAKGKEKAETTVKDKMSGKKTDYPAEIRREALKRYWASLSAEEKLQLLMQAGGLLSKGAKLMASAGLEAASELVGSSSGSGGSSSKQKEKEPEEAPKKSSKKSRSMPSIGWISELTTEDLQMLYDAYQQKKKVMSKIEKYQNKIVEESGKVGESIGTYIGTKRTEVEFIKRCNERKADFIVARKRYQFLKNTIEKNEDSDRYREEFEALHDALMNINGPAMVYIFGELNSKGRGRYPEICGIALSNLKLSHLKRPAFAFAESVGSTVKSGFMSIVNKIGGKGPEMEEQAEVALNTAQDLAANQLSVVVGKSWGSITSFWSKPAGVSAIAKALPKGKSSKDKLLKASILAKESAGKESSNRDAMTQIFYDALAEINLEDVQSITKTTSIIREIGGELG